MSALLLRVAASRNAHACLARLAREIWHQHYPGIISDAQIDYMLERSYSLTALAAEQAAGTRFVLAWRQDTAVGLAAVSSDAWLDKLYVHADARGSGVARALTEDAGRHARSLGANELRLRVNRHNRGAVAAYEHMGFVIVAEDRKDIGGGFVMDDYIMAQTLLRHA